MCGTLVYISSYFSPGEGINLSGHSAATLHDKLLVFGGFKSQSIENRAIDVSSSSSIAGAGAAPNAATRLSRKLFILSVLEIKHSMVQIYFESIFAQINNNQFILFLYNN